MRKQIQTQIQKLLDDKIIRPSISPYSAPVWIVPKKTDASGKRKFRMVIDYRKLNDKTVDDKYPLPRIEEILDNLGKSCYFTTLDLVQGFHQIEMHPNSIEKTAFTVESGHFEYLRMPFGLKNAPSTFQRVMDGVLKKYIHKFCFVYMDDVVVFSKSLHEHFHCRIASLQLLLTPLQGLRLTPIRSNGYFQEFLGRAKLVDHFHHFLFFINISQIETNYKQLLSNTAIINAKIPSDPTDEVTHHMQSQLHSLCLTVENLLNSFITRNQNEHLQTS